MREPEVFKGGGQSTVRVSFRGLRDSRTIVDRDTRVTEITIPAVQAARLWQLLGEVLTDADISQVRVNRAARQPRTRSYEDDLVVVRARE